MPTPSQTILILDEGGRPPAARFASREAGGPVRTGEGKSTSEKFWLRKWF
jgi:hypothetical protein